MKRIMRDEVNSSSKKRRVEQQQVVSIFDLPDELWSQSICMYLTREDIIHRLCHVHSYFYQLIVHSQFWAVRSEPTQFNTREMCNIQQCSTWTQLPQFSRISIRNIRGGGDDKYEPYLIDFIKWNVQLVHIELRLLTLDLIELINECKSLKILKLVGCTLIRSREREDELFSESDTSSLNLEKICFMDVHYMDYERDTLKNLLAKSNHLKKFMIRGAQTHPLDYWRIRNRATTTRGKIYDLTNNELTTLFTMCNELEKLTLYGCSPNIQDFIPLIDNHKMQIHTILLNDCNIPLQVLSYIASSNLVNTVRKIDVRNLRKDEKVQVPVTHGAFKNLSSFYGDSDCQLYMIDANLYDIQFEVVTTRLGVDLVSFTKKVAHTSFHRVAKLHVYTKDILRLLDILGDSPCRVTLNELTIDEVSQQGTSVVPATLAPFPNCKNIHLTSGDSTFCDSGYLPLILQAFPKMEQLSLNFKRAISNVAYPEHLEGNGTLKYLSIRSQKYPISSTKLVDMLSRFYNLETLYISSEIDTSVGANRKSVIQLDRSYQMKHVHILTGTTSLESILAIMLLFPYGTPKLYCRCKPELTQFKNILDHLRRVITIRSELIQSVNNLEMVSRYSDLQLFEYKTDIFVPWMRELTTCMKRY
jgi:hypothetical protein